ncbi:MAG: hypothetical protein AAGI36_19115 [Pseudomonadota bacterium]
MPRFLSLCALIAVIAACEPLDGSQEDINDLELAADGVATQAVE